MNYNPIEALLIFSGLLGLVMLIVWPEHGLWFRFKRTMQNHKRILMEDALKEIYESERNGQDYSIKSLAGPDDRRFKPSA